ncbi:hypothetical protein PTMSG1_01545 [Pyrenophora teres f. maculata]|nr:hypothetical protein PTMSG1_01545 [Pyrenophora teres f. maculata]
MSAQRSPSTTADAVSVKDGISYGDTVTARVLEERLGWKLLLALPDLSLNFCPQDEEEYLPICLNLGTCGDEVSNKVYGLYLYLKPSRNYNVAPGTCIVMNNMPVEKGKGKGREKKGDDNKGTQIDFHRLLNMSNSGMAQLIWPFRAIDKTEEFKAVAKWYFIKAAESRLHDFEDHDIPHNENFETQLRKACRRIMYAQNVGVDTCSEAYDKINFALAGMKGNKRTTSTSENVAQDMQMTGLTNLDDLPPDFLRGLDAPNRKNSIRNHSNNRTVIATKKERSQPDELDIQDRTVKRGLTVAHNGPTTSNLFSHEGDEDSQTPPRHDYHESSPSIGSAKVAVLGAATPDIIASPSSSAKSLPFRPASKGQHSSSPLSSPLSSVPASISEARRRERKAKADFLKLQKETLEGDILGKRKRMERLEYDVAYKQRKLERIDEKMRMLSKAWEDSEEEDDEEFE